MSIRLVVGLGNKGSDYEQTRHNAGFWFVERLRVLYNTNWSLENKFFASISKFRFKGSDVWLLKPETFMNLSGKAITAFTNFYKIVPEEIIVIHDELDFNPGIVKLKLGGGSGGHNGLKDISRVIGNNYWRLRIGVGHPGDRHQVANFVLQKPQYDEKCLIDNSIDQAVSVFELLLDGNFNQAMKNLHTNN